MRHGNPTETSAYCHLIPRPHILIISADMNTPGNIWRLLLQGNHQVHGFVIET